MEWLVFGDDWGAHPSTTQHLMRAMAAGDTVLWVGSIGMRAPRFNRADLRRVAHRLRAPTVAPASTGTDTPPGWRVLRPSAVPFHENALARWVNRRLLGRQIGQEARALGMQRPMVLTANPAVVLYLDDVLRAAGLEAAAVGYLRLDDYSLLPGVDASLVALTEPAMMARADRVFATARRLLPGTRSGDLVPQGVDTSHFGQVLIEPPAGPKTLGFFGLLAEWIDVELIAAVAKAVPDWSIELLGPSRISTASLAKHRNIVLRGPVPYAALPGAIAHWHAAWLPFRVDELSAAVNPVKLREYLAAGLPTMSTAMPEVMNLSGVDVAIIDTADNAARWLREVAARDTAADRIRRRHRMQDETWQARADQVRGLLLSSSSSSSPSPSPSPSSSSSSSSSSMGRLAAAAGSGVSL